MRVARSDVIALASLAAGERRRLFDDLFRVHEACFAGASREAFAARIGAARGERPVIVVHRTAAGEVVGYFAGHEFRRELGGRGCAILCGDGGLLREYGDGLAFGLDLKTARTLALQAPQRPLAYLGCLVHPAGYERLARSLGPIRPGPGRAPDDATRALMAELAEACGLARVGDDPLVRRVGWAARETEAERTFWRRSARPDVRFFVAANPDYDQGHGLLALVPLGVKDIAAATVRSAAQASSRELEAAADRARGLPLLSRWLVPAAIVGRLRAVPLFEGLTPAQLENLAERAELVQVPAGRVLVERGDSSGDLFVIAGGEVLIVAPGAASEAQVLDRLGSGEVFGEIAALTGEPRSMTVRAATPATLVRIARAQLHAVMAADPALTASLWGRLSERRFDDVTAGEAAFAGTTRESRREHLRRGIPAIVAAGESQAWRGVGHVFVAGGEVDCERGPTRIRGRAPLLLAVGDELRLTALATARIVRLPAMTAPAAESRQFRVHPLLARLSDETFAALLAAARPLRALRGQSLFAAGDVADAFYLVRSGAVEICVDDVVVTTLGAGECFGERGFDPAHSGRRTARARVAAPSDLLRVPGPVFATLAGPQLFAAAPPAGGVRDDLAPQLRAAWADAPASAVAIHHLPAGAVIMREGEVGDAAWFVVEGALRIDRGGVTVDRVGPGECVGERALLMHTPRTATVIAETAVVAHRVDAGEFAAWTAGHSRLRDLLATVSAVHGAGGTTVHCGSYEGRASMTAVTRLPDGRLFTATKLVDEPLLLLTAHDGGGPPTGQLEHARAPAGSRRRLEVRGDRPLSLLLEGDLGPAAAYGERLRSDRPLTLGELERFRWTGELGAPSSGPRRLLCGCVGLTRADLQVLQGTGCDSAEAVCARTGAGGVCGGCVPLVRRLLADPATEAPAAADEVDLDGLEASLDAPRHVDGARSLVGPESATWSVYGESVAILGGARALLMQFAHPAAQGFAEHSSFLSDAGQRYHSTLQSMYSLAFGDGATLLRMARTIHEKHARVSGRYARTSGPFRAGDRYSANQIPLLLWVAATVTDTTVHTYESLVGPLSLADKDRLVAEAARMYGLFGIPRDRQPADWRAFRAYVDGVLASEILHVSEHSRKLARAVLTAPTRASEPAFAVLRRLTARWLPPTLRTAYGMDEGPLERAAGAALERALRAAVPRLPPSLRICPARLHAERRLRGEDGPDPAGVRVEQLLAAALGVR
ncbi:cyclic nucleotide-binding domain-containing protein [Nannocystis punicea]|uniref:Cyclic nucleotide-binding domain-containing protein n=1 Tax=Nannocystis punicea TaxID=2995304 RepID=A0ABY7GWL1_9BACT|nr:cyclic nucleotide-binding domain-containing protein [Nannocystis poenicansa]WAS91264.1 cyclic nucleotide-binding domain-containing protein [Nannocystis poenicansa]